MNGSGGVPGRWARQGAFLALLGVAVAPLSARPVQPYVTVAVPPGSMTLRLPLNSYLQTDDLDLTVTVAAGLRMGRYPVSNRDWDACFRAGGCSRKSERLEGETPLNPVARVNWHEAAQFARWLSRATGHRYRLPTEQEWYYVYALGKGFTVAEGPGAGLPGAPAAAPKHTRPRGSFGVNAWGVADLGGNLWEWTLSCYTLSRQRLLSAPEPTALQDPDACVTRVLGGVSCASAPDFIRDAYSGGCGGGAAVSNIGFRLVEEELP